MTTEKSFWKSRIRKWTALDPTDRLSEVLFGLIMVLGFTGTISTSTSGRQDIDQLLWTALGCNMAWGLVDAIMNLMDTVISRAHGSNQFRKLKKAKTTEETIDIVKTNISPLIAEVMKINEMEILGKKIKELPDPEEKTTITFKDILIAGEIFLMVFLSTFPVVLPFVLLNDVIVALRISNLIALVLMFTAGYILARYAGLKPVLTATVYTILGILLVAITMVLGG